jgi:hypothetical protein
VAAPCAKARHQALVRVLRGTWPGSSNFDPGAGRQPEFFPSARNTSVNTETTGATLTALLDPIHRNLKGALFLTGFLLLWLLRGYLV